MKKKVVRVRGFVFCLQEDSLFLVWDSLKAFVIANGKIGAGRKRLKTEVFDILARTFLRIPCYAIDCFFISVFRQSSAFVLEQLAPRVRGVARIFLHQILDVGP